MKDRRFLLKTLPPESKRWKTVTLQIGWMEAGNRELVVRAEGDKQYLSVELCNQRPAPAHQFRLENSDFAALWPETQGKRLCLERRKGRIGRYAVTIDIYQDELAGLSLVEVSAPEADCARTTLGWDWLGIEVGYDPRFELRALSLRSVDPAQIQAITTDRFTGTIGAIPYVRQADELKIVLCTTPRRDRWIFPKGQTKPGLTLRDVALMEAAEEAGLIGEVSGESILCSYSKANSVVDLILFPMEVKSMLKIWQESENRERGQFSIAELRSKTDTENLIPGLALIEELAAGWRLP